MTKEELLEMVNATISGNGKQEITGQSLNLALTEIINAMGTGNGGNSEIVYFLPSNLASQPESADPSPLSTEEDILNELVQKNIELYQKLSNAHHEGKSIQVCTDLSFFYTYDYDYTMTVIIPSTIVSSIVTARPMSTDPSNYYADGEVAILIIPQRSDTISDIVGTQVDFWLLPNGFVEPVYTGLPS